jgi:hypothetical protein
MTANMQIDWATVALIVLGNGVLTALISLKLSQLYQNEVWLKDQKRAVYSRLAAAVFHWESLLENSSKNETPPFDLIAEAMLLIKNPQLEELLERFIKTIEMWPTVQDDKDEALETQYRLASLGPQIRMMLKQDLLGSRIKQNPRSLSVVTDIFSMPETNSRLK